MSRKIPVSSSYKKNSSSETVSVQPAASVPKSGVSSGSTKAVVNKPSQVSKAEIEKLAYLIFKENKSYDVYVWLYAEAQLKLQNGKQPSEAEIKTQAQKIASMRKSARDLHWGIAEMRLHYQKLH